MCHHRSSCSVVIPKLVGANATLRRHWKEQGVSSFSSRPSHDGRVGNEQSQSGAVQGGAASKTNGGGYRALPVAGAPERASALEGTRCFELFLQCHPCGRRYAPFQPG